MPNPESEHLNLVKSGASEVATWRRRNPNSHLNLISANLAGVSFVGFGDLTFIDMRNATFKDADLSGCDLQYANIQGASFAGAILVGTRFSRRTIQQFNFEGADLRRADLSEANIKQAVFRKCDLAGAKLSGADAEAAYFNGAILRGSNLQGARLIDADLTGADISGALLVGANLSGATLTEVSMTGASLKGADLTNATLRNSTITNSDFDEATLSNADFWHAKGVHSAKHLDKTRVGEPNARYFDTVERKWLEQFVDWERLRTFGKLPLFSASYSVLVLIPTFFYLQGIYNEKIALIRAWADHIVPGGQEPFHSLAMILLERLHQWPIPRQSLYLLLSTVLLAIGSTLYVIACPSRIKEFSRDQWVDQLGKPLLHYWSLAWKHRVLRVVSAICYTVGGAGVLWVIATKVWRVLGFIVKNSDLPWHPL